MRCCHIIMCDISVQFRHSEDAIVTHQHITHHSTSHIYIYITYISEHYSLYTAICIKYTFRGVMPFYIIHLFTPFLRILVFFSISNSRKYVFIYRRYRRINLQFHAYCIYIYARGLVYNW